MNGFSVNRTFLTMLAIVSLWMGSVPGGKAGAMNTRASDETAIRENVRQMEAGWNAKQGTLFAKPFTEDADYVVINGMYFKGRTEIEKSHQRIFDTFYKNTTINLIVRQVRFLRPDVALVHVSGHLDAPEKQFVADASMTMVMTRDKQGWKIAAFQNTEVTTNQQR